MILRTASLALCFAAAIVAQAPGPTFASATIRESADQDARAGYLSAPGKFALNNQTLSDCARMAYEVDVARAGGAPKWIETQRFDIEVDGARFSDEREMKAMLRALLQNRFKLALHRESKMVPGYALVAARGGLKIKGVEAGPGHINARPGSIRGERASMENLAQSLAVIMGKPVIDKTALAGVFTFSLDWVPRVVQPGALTTDDEDSDDRNVLPDPPGGPTLFLALERQLGLKLEGRKVLREILVIDRAERP